MPEPLSSKQLMETLSVDQKTINRWVRRGMPFKKDGRKRVFDAEMVEAWLIDEGLARVPASDEVVLTTRNEVASYFQVSIRTVATWLSDPSFPGKSGDTTGVGGRFPVGAIDAWRQQKTQGGVRSEFDDQIKAEQLRKLKLHNNASAGQLVDAEEVRRRNIRPHTLARRILDAIPDEIKSVMPADSPPVVISEVRRMAQLKVEEACATLAGLINERVGQHHGSILQPVIKHALLRQKLRHM